MNTNFSPSELLQTLDISAGAGIAGWGTDTKIDSKFFDRTEVRTVAPSEYLMRMLS